jgi:hypothetical protein
MMIYLQHYNDNKTSVFGMCTSQKVESLVKQQNKNLKITLVATLLDSMRERKSFIFALLFLILLLLENKSSNTQPEERRNHEIDRTQHSTFNVGPKQK